MPPLHHYLPIIHSVISIFSTFSMFYLSIYLYSSNNKTFAIQLNMQ